MLRTAHLIEDEGDKPFIGQHGLEKGTYIGVYIPYDDRMLLNWEKDFKVGSTLICTMRVTPTPTP